MLTRRAALAAPLLPLAAQAQPRPSIVATFTILQDMAARVAGGAATVASLVPRDGDPHAFEPRPADLAAIRGAALVVENGLSLEGWLGRMVQASGFKGVRVVATAGLKPRRLDAGPDPHMWQDPAHGRQMVRNIADGLAKADPANAAAYRQRAADYDAALQQLDAQVAQALAPVPPARRKVLTTHDAFAYYGARFGIEFVSLEGISTDAEPSPRSLARVAQLAKREGIRTVFLENMTDPRLAQALAREAGLAVGPKLYADSLSPLDGPAPTYLDLLRYNTQQLVAAMTA